MKQCEHCGSRNEDDATRCRECGETWFTPVPQALKSENGKNERHFVFRFLVSLLMGLAVFGLSLHTAWQKGGAQEGARREQWLTQYYLEEIDRGLKVYQKEFNAYPTSLIQLQNVTNKSQFDYHGNLDGWHNEFVYSIEGTNGLATSYGRDGKPGGDGLDCDLTNLNPEPRASLPTFRQFLFEMPVKGVIYSCQVSGVLAVILCFYLVKKPEFTLSRILSQTAYLLILLVVASFVAGIISMLHIPAGGGH